MHFPLFIFNQMLFTKTMKLMCRNFPQKLCLVYSLWFRASHNLSKRTSRRNLLCVNLWVWLIVKHPMWGEGEKGAGGTDSNLT